MNQQAILIPVFAQVALSFALLFTLGSARVAAVKRGEVAVKDIALGQKAWPARIAQNSNSFDSQFQVPVLFYVLVGLALTLNQVDTLLISGAWVFAASRMLHALVHVTTNRIAQRFNAFLAGVLVLASMWLWFAARTLAGISL
jgi:hypothetical protein